MAIARITIAGDRLTLDDLDWLHQTIQALGFTGCADVTAQTLSEHAIIVSQPLDDLLVP